MPEGRGDASASDERLGRSGRPRSSLPSTPPFPGAVLVGIVAGAAVAVLLENGHFDKLASTPWIDRVYPLQFGWTKFALMSTRIS